MRLVFIGSTNFGMKCLKECCSINNIDVVGIITAPKKFDISYSKSKVNNVSHADFYRFANDQNIPIESIKKSMHDELLVNSVLKWNPDLLLVVGWYHMIPKSYRSIAPAYGLHASLLPEYSGGAPLVWAIINGEKKTGISLFQMNDGVDSGPIAGQKVEIIRSNDTISSLYKRIEEKGMSLISEVMPILAKGELKLTIQDESKRSIFPQRSPSDGLINWNESSSFIERFIRAQTKPYPGAFASFKGKKLHIWKAESQKKEISNKSGKIFKNYKSQFSVSCGKGSIKLIEVNYESKFYTGDQLVNLFVDKENYFDLQIKN